MSDQYDEEAAEREAEAADNALEAGAESDEDQLVAGSDSTLSTPTPTIEMHFTPSGEQRIPKRDRWMRSLNRAIAEHPESPTNYVLRGELALESRAYDQAISDFKKALELASIQLETSTWGIVAQVMQDRAHRGLQEARRKRAKRRR